MDASIDITNTTLETDRLILRAWKKSDLAAFYEYAKVPGVGELAGWRHHSSIEQTKEILSSFIDKKNVFAIEHKGACKVIGSLGLHPSWANETVEYFTLPAKEIGYVLSKDYWGRGLMPEAVTAAITFCFWQCDIELLTVGHFSHNHQSRRVIEKCGFTFVKQREHYAKQLDAHFTELQYLLHRPAQPFL